MALGILSLVVLVVPFVVCIVLGIVLMRAAPPRGRGFPACGGCGYDVRATLGESVCCPECGGDFRAIGVLPAQAGRSAVRVVAIILFCLPVLMVLTCGVGLVLPAFASSRARPPMAAPSATSTGSGGVFEPSGEDTDQDATAPAATDDSQPDVQP